MGLRLIVMKFGEKCLSRSGGMKETAKLVSENSDNKLVLVASALAGVSTGLLKAAENASKGKQDLLFKFLKELRTKHSRQLSEAIGRTAIQKTEAELNEVFSELEKVLTSFSYLGEVTPRAMDYISSFGGRLSAENLATCLNQSGLKAKAYTGKEAGIVTDSNFGEASPLVNATKYQVKSNLAHQLEAGVMPVVASNTGITQDGHATSLGKGGDDYTATLLGAALEADEIWIWTEVNGLMTTDPKVMSGAKAIPELSFQEVLEMASFGARPIHPKVLKPVAKDGPPIRIRSFLYPKNPGTLLVRESRVKPGDVAKAATIIKDVSLINVSGSSMIGTPGVAAKILEVLGRNGAEVLMISQSVSEANISLLVPRTLAGRVVSSLETSPQLKEPVDDISVDDEVCAIALVGAGMKGTPGVAARVFGCIAKKKVNVMVISQGSSEYNISFVVKERDGEEAVRALHEEFRLGV